jgi:TRAP-type C4-dicarboxylate transport system substrate-binding protein
VTTLFHPAKLPLNNVTYFVPYGPTDAGVMIKAIDHVQTLPELTAEWSRHNIVYLGAFTLDDYGMTTKFPLTKLEDLKGRKIGGAGANLAWLKNTGAVGVQTSLNTAYNDLKNGIYDGNLIFITGAVPAKLFEVSPNFNVVRMGAMYAGALAVNRDRWRAFPEEVRAAFRKGSDAYKAGVLTEQSARISAAMDAWAKGGGKVVTLPPAEQARLVKAIPNPAVDFVKQTGPAGKKVLSTYMDSVRATGYRFQRDFDKE